MNYTDFTIRARDYENGHLKVEVTGSPVDRMQQPEVVHFDEKALRQPLRHLENKRISLDSLIALGKALSDVLLPPTVRQMLLRSLDAIEISPSKRRTRWRGVLLDGLGGGLLSNLVADLR